MLSAKHGSIKWNTNQSDLSDPLGSTGDAASSGGAEHDRLGSDVLLDNWNFLMRGTTMRHPLLPRVVRPGREHQSLIMPISGTQVTAEERLLRLR
jgi:hypothetical protein